MRAGSIAWSPRRAAGARALPHVAPAVLAAAAALVVAVTLTSALIGAARPGTRQASVLVAPPPAASASWAATALSPPGSGAPASAVRGGLSAGFGRDGVRVRIGSTPALTLRLMALGRGRALSPIAPVRPVSTAGLVQYAHAGLREWYRSGPLGLEQLFTVARRPAGTGALVLVVATVAPGVRAQVLAHGRTVLLRASGGRLLARYTGLAVTDADARSLPARIELAGRRLLLVIDDRGARYPLRVDPYTLAGKLAQPSVDSVALSASGGVLAAGEDSDEVDVYVEPSSGWKHASPTVVLKPPPAQAASPEGVSVAVSADGRTIVAGDLAQDNQGVLSVYTEPKHGWKHSTGEPVAILSQSDSTGQDELGLSVAIDAAGDEIAAGAPGWNNDEGALYLFTKPSGGWGSVAQPHFQAVNEGTNDLGGGEFGWTVAISGDGHTVVVGAPFTDGFLGEAWMFKVSGQTYLGQRAFASPGVTSASDPFQNIFVDCTSQQLYFGTSVAIAQDAKTIAIGEPCGSSGGVVDVYSEPPGGWLAGGGSVAAEATPFPDYQWDTQLGGAVAVSGDGKAIVTDDQTYEAAAGLVDVFERGNNATITIPTDLVYEGNIAVSSDAHTIAVPALASNGSGGVVYVYTEKKAGRLTLSCHLSAVAIDSASTCTATVEGSGGDTPTGHVSFSAPGLSRFDHSKCKLRQVSGHHDTAACHVSFTPDSIKAYTITGRYGGDPNYKSASATTVVAALKAPTTTTITCSPASITAGMQTTCTATVTGIDGIPPDVDFGASGGAFSGESCHKGGAIEVCTAMWTSTIASSTAYRVSAFFLGDATNLTSLRSTSVLVTAPANPTSTTVNCNPPDFFSDQSSTCTASVTQITGPATPPSVEFTSTPGGAVLGGENCNSLGGPSTETCTIPLSVTSAGTYTITATFPGDSDAGASSASTMVTVANLHPTSTSVACSLGTEGQYACTASVTDTASSAATPPTGTVSWTSHNTAGTTSIGQCTLTGGGRTNECTIDYTPPTRTSYTVTANYSGDQEHMASSGSTTVSP